MTESKHTPGPWSVEPVFESDDYGYLQIETGGETMTVHLNRLYNAANSDDNRYLFWASSSCGRIEMVFARRDVAHICHSGPNDLEVGDVMRRPHIAAQLDAITPEAAIDYLKKRGIEQGDGRYDWREYIVWTFAWDIFDSEEYDID